MTRLDAGPRHRDVLGSDVLVRRGVLNLMTSGAGIAHSEYSVGDDAVPLDALQLWVALPESRRDGAQAFERHEDLPVVDLGGGARATVVVGAFGGASSPATMYTPIAGVEVNIPAGASITLPLEPAWEYALVEAEGAPGAAPTRFGHVVGHGDERIPAPPLPAVRLTQRRRRP